MITLKFEADADAWFIIHALRVAASIYARDAERMAQAADHESCARQFRDQEARALALADQIEAQA